MPISVIQQFANQIYAQTLEHKCRILKGVRDEDPTTTVAGEITHYTILREIDCQIGPRTRRDASLFKTQVQEVQGEIIVLTKLADADDITDADVLRTDKADYSVRFAVNDANPQEVYGHFICEKLSYRVEVR